MDDLTIFASLVILVATTVGIVVSLSELKTAEEPLFVVEDTPLPKKKDVLKKQRVLDDSDAQTAETVDTSDDLVQVKASKPKKKSKRWSRVTEPKRDPNQKTYWVWRPKRTAKAERYEV